jgi:hypothetical protein|tara:strand:- start:129 stop:263 length:135 start_codon:yes stop_codon:yes gene_type:complete
MKAKYCKCTNTYSINCDKYKNKKKCNAPDYWKQGIGQTSKNEDE